MAAYYWVDTVSRGGVPHSALHGGTDVDGAPIYVGRAFHEGDWIPAKVIPDKRVAYIAYGGQEIPVHKYQVLCEQTFDWVPAGDGHIPQDAVVGGRTSDGENLYIGRVHHEGANTVGKVHPSHGSCYIPFGGQELGFKDYEILVLKH
ncbi:natterin-3-like [Cylas formicarius]|uniref:natterin-3-like n=1 Tax=Cylas formicarius TaxID=197179 RepID=UPI002958D01F|nr:natterin-3-like [Cylas formicarius]